MTEPCPCCHEAATEKCDKCGGLFCKVHVNTARMHVNSDLCKNLPDKTPDDFVPSDVDINFIKTIMGGLKVGDVWAYKSIPLVFQKRDDKTLAVVASYMTELFPSIEDQIHRNKLVLEAAGYVFMDARPKT